MERFLYAQLLAWKNSGSRKPLILEGARQVGKTWLLKEFGKNEYEHFIYINCDGNPQMENLFMDFDVERIIRNISAMAGVKIDGGNCLIVFDEIQEFPKALTSLKYFCENRPDIHIAVAGSLLGLLEHHGTGFPVGKVDSLFLYPLSFMEFLCALGQTGIVELMRTHNWQDLNGIMPKLIELLRQYYFTGGMPEVVSSYVKTQDLQQVRTIQQQIISDYMNDISKHALKSEISKITLVWHSIPSQLAKENKKFIYGALKKSARSKEFENAIQWLLNAGLIHKVNRVKKLEMPLKFYENFECFKLFMNDLGLLGAMVQAPAAEILVGNNVFSSYKGSFTEQYVAQQFFAASQTLSKNLYYYTNDNSTLEIDFVLQGDMVYPVEVKAEVNLKSKSLSTVLKNNDKLFGLRFSMANYKSQDRIINVPLPLVEEYFRSTT